MVDTPIALLFMIASWGIGLLVLYFLIRLAVRHAIEDADRRRASERPRTW